MDRIGFSYQTRLNVLSVLLTLGLAAPIAVLGFAIAGLEFSWVFLVVATVLALVRTPRLPLPGTYPLSPLEAPGLFTLVEALARRAGLSRLPEIRIVPGGQINAAATLRGSVPVLVVTEALLGRLDTRRLGAVLAHEISHIAHGDLVLFRVAQIYQLATVVLGFITAVLAVFSLAFDPVGSLWWMVASVAAAAVSRAMVAALSRTREFAADWGAARLTGDPGALADALETIEYRPRTWWDWVVGRRFPVSREPAGDAFRTHPPTVERVRRLSALAAWAS
jgi:heat shock protein HtpX